MSKTSWAYRTRYKGCRREQAKFRQTNYRLNLNFRLTVLPASGATMQTEPRKYLKPEMSKQPCVQQAASVTTVSKSRRRDMLSPILSLMAALNNGFAGSNGALRPEILHSVTPLT